MPMYTARIDPEAVATAATETLVQIVTGSTRQVKVKEWGVSFDGVTATATPIRVDLLRQTTAGTSSSLTVMENDPTGPAVISTALQDFSAEPTAGDVLWSEYITPAGGFDRVQLPLGEEIVVDVSTRIGLRVVVPSGSNCNAIAYIKFEE